tara:strand:- start:408 stop:1064 length:657 start_codon:yes stop_codon:yes gene_type:complete
MFKIVGNDLCYDDRRLGPKTALFVDSNELVGVTEGVVRLSMPRRIDMVFCAGDKVVGVESKYQGDLTTSQGSRRLARQLRVLLSECDIACLLLRHILIGPAFYQAVWQDLVRMQALGVVLLPGSMNDSHIPMQLAAYQEYLAGGRAPLAAIAGTDKTKRVGRGPGWFLTMLKGVGPVVAARLHGRFGSTKAALNAPGEEWREMKVSQKVIERREEAMK